MPDFADDEAKRAWLDGALAFERGYMREEYPPCIHTLKRRAAFRAGWDAERRAEFAGVPRSGVAVRVAA